MHPTDGEWVRRCLDDRPDAFRHLVRRHEGPLMRYLIGRLGDQLEAAEAAQETFVRAYFALGKLKKPEAFFSWLVGIAHRVAKEGARARRRRREVAFEGDLVEAAPEQNDSATRQLPHAVAGLPELYREVVLLRYSAGMSCADVSRHLGVPVGTVTKRLSRAYALLRESLQSPTDPQDAEVPS